MPSGPPPRDYLIEEYTHTVCPACFAERPRRSDEPGTFIDGLLVSHSGSVWMRRFCPVHGESESLYEEDAALWRARKPWRTATATVTPDRPGNFRGFPDGYRDGLPASHGQHTCTLVLNVTERCNYRCPACYAAARPPGELVPTVEHPTVDEVLHTVTVMLEREQGHLGVVMLSGGEPTVREDLPELLDRLAELSITRVMLNTNGRRIAKDDRLLETLRRLRAKVEVYLQFDGLRPEAYQALRGDVVIDEKLAALRRLDDAGVFCTLVTTVARGLNEDDLGSIIRLGINTPHCAGVAFQPVFGSGRAVPIDPRSRATPTGVLRRLSEQTGGLLAADDFIALPCSHQDCCDVTYLLRGEEGWRSLPKLVGRERLLDWLDVIGNTITFDELRDPVVEIVRGGGLPVLNDGACDGLGLCDCAPDVFRRLGGVWARLTGRDDTLEQLAQRLFRVTVKMFMDTHTFHEARLRQCCVHVPTFEEDPRRHSFCWRWLFADATDTPWVLPLSALEDL